MTEAKSTQPQLPPRPETYMDRTTERIKPGEDAPAVTYITALEAENESLKEQIVEDAEVIEDHKEARREASRIIRSLKAENESLKAELTAMTEDRNLWQQAHDEDCPNLATVETLKAEGDHALEVIREYRKIHPGCCIRIAGLVNETKLDGRCPTCIKADELLKEK